MLPVPFRADAMLRHDFQLECNPLSLREQPELPRGLGVRQPSGALEGNQATKSARGLAHSKTQARFRNAFVSPGTFPP
jgi:hypothetical protein